MIFVSFSIEKTIIPHTYLALFVPTNLPIPTKSNLYLANSLAAAVSEPALYRLLTFHVPNLASLFRCLGCTKVSIQVQFRCSCFVTKPVFMVRNCQHFAITFHIESRSSIRSLRMHHAMVTGSHPSWVIKDLLLKWYLSLILWS